MNAYEVIGSLAEQREVERIVLRLSGASRLTPSLQDLCQIIYETLLNKPSSEVEALAQRGKLSHYINGMVQRQLMSSRSRYYHELREFSARSEVYDEGE